MTTVSRRDFLVWMASASALVSNRNGEEQARGGPPKTGSPRTPASIDRFIDPLPIPKRARPHSITRGTTEYRIPMIEFTRRLHSQLPPTRLWGFDGQYPGPTFEVSSGDPVVVHWENHLPLRHLFPVDTHIHGAMPPAPAVRTVTHLHGSRTPSDSDGLPEKWFTPGHSARYVYPNRQQAATLWYHDHALGITRLNVYAGLSGFYLLRDERERGMELPAGDYEIPLLLQDRTLDDRSQLVYSPAFENGELASPGVWAPEFFGDLPVVNGAVYPFVEVEPRPYRLRLLNGSNSRFFHLYFNLAVRPTDIPSLVSFDQIGSDGGFLPRPCRLQRILLGPAERADLLIDFSTLAARTVTLSNNAASPYPGWGILGGRHAPLYELLQFRVTLPPGPARRALSLPAPVDFPALDETAAMVTRKFILRERMAENGHSLGVFINNEGYDAPVSENVKLGSVEKWVFINATDDAHPMHLHLIQFRILSRQGFDAGAMAQGAVRPAGPLQRPGPGETGWKDTAVVYPGEMLTILAKFDGYAGRYVYHCHMLEHEDNDMMRPYVVARQPD